ncbi:MAG TPA: hypothetical protein VEK39_14105 [Solirubrobacterales bacterium]|nr:hypothetical protein [Solirubrobacterales bacterium]
MTGVSYRRIGGAAGIVAMVLLVVGFLLPGAPPKADDSLQEITSYLVDKRSSLLAGSFVIGLGMGAFLVWLSALRGLLEAGDRDGILPRVAFAAGVVAAVLNTAGAAVTAGIVFEAAGLGDAILNRALFDTSIDLFTITGFPIAVLFASAALSASATGALPRWAVPTGLVVALLQLVSVVGIFASSGFFATGGAFGFIAFVPAVAWVIAVGVVMLRGAGETRASTA